MNSNYRNFTLRLKEKRIRCGLTQQLCRCLKTPQNALNRAETGYICLPYSKLKYLCTTDMYVYYVFTGDSPTIYWTFQNLSSTFMKHYYIF